MSRSSASNAMYMEATAGAVEHCESMARQFPDLADVYYHPMASYCQEKLWHQLTLAILDLVHDPSAVRRTVDQVHSYRALYEQVVLRVDRHLHALSLARIAAAVAQSLASSALSQDMTTAKSILENLLVKKDGLGRLATIYVESKLSLLTLHALPPEGSASRMEALASIKTVMRNNATALNELLVTDNVDQAIVHAAHYEQAMMYYKIVGPPEAFYEQAMSFLNYAPPPTATSQQPMAATIDYHQLAVDLCLAALTGDGVYNLNQVLENTPMQLIQLLKDSPEQWLVELLTACADGDVTGFAQLTSRYADAIAKQPALVHRAVAVQEKLTLLALVKTVFAKPAHERTLSFAEIASSLQVAEDQVEWIAMRALSAGLLQGTMDQVDRTLQVTWVLPRVLTKQQMEDLAARFGEWAGKVTRIQEKIQEQTATFA